MIVLEKMSWLKIFFSWKGGVLSRIWVRVTAATVFAAIITYLFKTQTIDPGIINITTLPFSLIGLALSIFLGFRNNSSYDRFWEGRKLWGRMINTTRTFTRQIFMVIEPGQALENDDAADRERQAVRREMVRRLVAYLHAFRHHLRDQRKFPDSMPFLSNAEGQQLLTEPNAPIWLLHRMGERLREMWRQGWVDNYHLTLLEHSLTTMTDIQGGCERIKKTPIPFAYTVLMHRIVGVYCFTLPFGIFKEVGWLTPMVVLMISFSFFGLDAIGDEIEEPFGLDDNDLSLSAFTNMLEIECRTRLGDKDLPARHTPVKGVLN